MYEQKVGYKLAKDNLEIKNTNSLVRNIIHVTNHIDKNEQFSKGLTHTYVNNHGVG